MKLTEYLHFFYCWLKSPRAMGAINPSGSVLAEAFADQIAINQPGAVIELGGGTGSLTRGILASGLEPTRLYVIEREKKFCQILTKKFPQVHIIHGDASSLENILRDHNVAQINAIISGLPLLTLPEETRDSIIQQIFNLLQGPVKFLQFTYGLRSSVPESFLQQFDCSATPSKRIWRNFPPATVWCYTQKAKVENHLS